MEPKGRGGGGGGGHPFTQTDMYCLRFFNNDLDF